MRITVMNIPHFLSNFKIQCAFKLFVPLMAVSHRNKIDWVINDPTSF